MAVNKCIKSLLFLFNFLFWVGGCVILGLSIYIKVERGSNKITNEAVPGVDLLIAVGVIIMVLGFLGCCGAYRENRCMLLMFFIALLLIFILLVAAGIIGAVYEDKAMEWAKEGLSKLIPLKDQTADVQTDLQKLEEEFKCCGVVDGPKDWAGKIPDSCECKDTEQKCETVGGKRVYSTSCSTFIIDTLKSQMKIVLGVAFAIAILLIFGMAFAMSLYCQIGKRDGPTTA